MYRAADGKYKSAGTYGSHERAYEVASDEEQHVRGFLDEAGPADKAKMTVAEFCEQRFLRYHPVSPGTRQGTATWLGITSSRTSGTCGSAGSAGRRSSTCWSR